MTGLRYIILLDNISKVNFTHHETFKIQKVHILGEVTFNDGRMCFVYVIALKTDFFP